MAKTNSKVVYVLSYCFVVSTKDRLECKKTELGNKDKGPQPSIFF